MVTHENCKVKIKRPHTILNAMNIIIDKDELCCVLTDDGKLCFKVGDGKTIIKNLPNIDPENGIFTRDMYNYLLTEVIIDNAKVSSDLISKNEILPLGYIQIEKDKYEIGFKSNFIKIGDGKTSYNSLPYIDFYMSIN
jgi:hypothetical protein